MTGVILGLADFEPYLPLQNGDLFFAKLRPELLSQFCASPSNLIAVVFRNTEPEIADLQVYFRVFTLLMR